MADLRPTGGRRRLGALCALAVIATSTIAGCGDDDAPAPKPSASVTTPSAADEASDVFKKYWDVYVQISNSGEVNRSAFDGIASGVFLESVLKNLGDQAESGVVRVGNPTFSDFESTVNGDEASSVVCVDESKWAASVEGETIPDSTSETPEPRPYVGTLEKSGDSWIVTDVAAKEGTACP